MPHGSQSKSRSGSRIRYSDGEKTVKMQILSSFLRVFGVLLLLSFMWLFISRTAGVWPFPKDEMKKKKILPGRTDAIKAEVLPSDSQSPPELAKGQSLVVMVGMDMCRFCVDAIKDLKEDVKAGKIYYLSLVSPVESTLKSWFKNLPGMADKVASYIKTDGRVPYFIRIRRGSGEEGDPEDTYAIAESTTGYDTTWVQEMISRAQTQS